MVEIRKLTASLNLGGNAVSSLGSFGLAMNGAKQAIGLVVGAFNIAKDVLFDFTTGMADQGDVIAKNARNAGLSAESYQELSHAFELAGSSGATVTKSMQRLSKNIVDARVKGTGPFVDQLKDLNIGIEEFDQLSPDEAFAKVADIVKGISDPMEKMAFAQDALGRGGKELIPLLNEGAEGIAKYREEARELGLFTNEQALLSENLVDAQGRLNRVLEGVKITIASELMPITLELIDGVRDWIQENDELIKVKLQEFIQDVTDAARSMAPALRDIADALTELIPLVIETMGEFGIFWKQLNDLNDDIENGYAPGWKLFGEVIEGVITPFNLLGNAVGWVSDNMELLLKFAGPIGVFLSQFIDDVNELPRASKRGLTGAKQVQVTEGPGGGGVEGTRASAAKDASIAKAHQAKLDSANTLTSVRNIVNNRKLPRNVRETANVKLNRLLDEDAAFIGGQIETNNARAAKEAGRGRKRPKKRKGGKKKKDEKMTDEELLSLINTAGSTGQSLTGLIGDRDVPVNVPPVVTIQIEKNEFDIDINAPITVTGEGGQSIVDIGTEVRTQFDTMLGDTIKEALSRQEPARGS